MLSIRKVAAVLTVAMLAATPAHADLKMVIVVTFNSAGLKAEIQKKTPEQRAQYSTLMRDGHMRMVCYVSGVHTRTDADADGVIILKDTARQKSIVLIPSRHLYMAGPYHLSQRSRTGQMSVQVTDTGQTGRIAGHPAGEYLITGNVKNAPVSGFIWAATDLPPVSDGLLTGSPAVQALWRQVKGTPLQMTLILDPNGPARTTITYQALSISTASLPASLFTVPRGYKIVEGKPFE